MLPVLRLLLGAHASLWGGRKLRLVLGVLGGDCGHPRGVHKANLFLKKSFHLI